MSKEWITAVYEIVEDPDRQAEIIESSRIAGEGFDKLKIESQEIKREHLKIVACYDCDLTELEPVLERIQKAEQTSTKIILDMMDVVRENTTKKELQLLIKRKLEP